MTAELTDLIITACSDPQLNLLDSLACTQAALVSAMANVVGGEFAAYFVQTLVAKFESERNNHLSENGELTKRCANMATLVAYLFSFSVIGAGLITDLVTMCVTSGLSELDVDVTLRILKGTPLIV